MKLKRLSLFLALVMILSAFAGTFTFASAEDVVAGGTFEVYRDGVKVETIDKDHVTTISAAMRTDSTANEGKKIIETGDTIKLTGAYTSTAVEELCSDNTDETTRAASGIAITIEGNGYTISKNGSGRLFNSYADLTIRNATLTSNQVAGVLQMNGSATTLTLTNVVINANAAPTSGAVVVTGASQQVVITDSIITSIGAHIYSNGDDADIEITDSLLYGTAEGGIHAVIQLRANNPTLTIDGSTFVDKKGPYTRVVSTYGTGVAIEVKDSTLLHRCSDSVFEFNKGAEAAPNNLVIDNSDIIQLGNSQPVVDTDPAAVYTNVTVKNGSYLYAAGVAIQLRAKNGTVAIENSTINAVSSAITSVEADAKITVKNSGLRTATADTAVVTGATPTYTNSATVVASTLTKQGTVTMSDDNLYGIAGMPFRAGNSYYATLTEATAASKEVFIVGDYYTTVRETHNGMTSLTGVAKVTGEYPTVYTIQRFTANVTNNTTWKNFNVINYTGDCNQQINSGTLTIDNVNMIHKSANGALVLNGGAVIVKNSTLVAHNSGTIRLNQNTVSAEVINSTLIGRESGVPVHVLNNGTPNMTLKVDADSVLDASKASAGIYIVEKTTLLNIVDSYINIKVGNSSTGISISNTNTGTLNVVNSTIKTFGADNAASTTYAPITTMAANTINIINSTLDGSEADMHRAIYQNNANAVLNITNSTLKASTASGTCPVIKASGTNTTFTGVNTISGGWLTKNDAIWFFEAVGNSANMTYADKDATSITLGATIKSGAGIRTVKGSSGIRFISEVSAEMNAQLQAAVEAGTIAGYSFGTIVMKASDLEGTTVKAAIAGGAANVAIPAVNGIKENEDGSVSIFAALVNIKDKNLNTEFAGIAYIDITIAEGVVVRIYSDYNAEDNARSITEVAKKALGDVKTTSSNEIVDGFRYNNELAEGETYYVDGVAKVVAEGEKLYSAYNADQREVIAAYLA